VPEISFETGGAIYGVSPKSATSLLSAGYRESEARLHNQTKNVKIPHSAADVRSVRTSKSAENIYEKS